MNISAHKIRVAVICGGISSERDVSLKSGQQVLKHLDPSRYEPRLVEIAANGQWFLKDTGTLLQIDVTQAAEKGIVPVQQPSSPTLAERPFDVAFISLHGSFGEDGRIQALLDLLKVPYTGSGVLASSLCMNKTQARDLVSGLGIAVPKGFMLHKRNLPPQAELENRIEQEIGFPCIVKPNASGSSIGISLVRSKEALAKALAVSLEEDRSLIIEQYIQGREITCGILGNASIGGALTALPPVEIMPDGEFFDYRAKYSSELTKEVCPAQLEPGQTEEVKKLALTIHERMGCDGLSRSDFILKDSTFYFLETNTIPGLTEQSLCPKEAAAAGMSFAEFLGRQIELALEKHQDAEGAPRDTHE